MTLPHAPCHAFQLLMPKVGPQSPALVTTYSALATLAAGLAAAWPVGGPAPLQPDSARHRLHLQCL